MQQVSIDSRLQGVSLQLCLSFLPPRALGRGRHIPSFLQEQRRNPMDFI